MKNKGKSILLKKIFIFKKRFKLQNPEYYGKETLLEMFIKAKNKKVIEKLCIMISDL